MNAVPKVPKRDISRHLDCGISRVQGSRESYTTIARDFALLGVMQRSAAEHHPFLSESL
jgi:hypothetical protein